MPTEPPRSGLRSNLRARAYACQEQNGIVWAYLGPPEHQPTDVPGLGWAVVPAGQRALVTYQRRCNWAQALEGDVDTAHLGWLHSRFAGEDQREVALHDGDRLRDAVLRDHCPELDVAHTRAGVTIAARREYDEARHYWRISQFLMPIFTSVPAIGAQRRAKAWIPLDDAHTMVWEASWHPSRDLTPDEQDARPGRIPKSGMQEEGADPLSRGRFAAGREDDYRIDRQRQRTGNYSGLEESIPLQDAAVQESMGAIVDRSREHLGASDAGIVQVRRRLLEAARLLRDGDAEPPGVTEPDAYRVRGCQMLLERGADWRAASRADQEG
jgi:phenylpropionate dioxygenase-like ring-hydroxylating dioxygenase large terminal subunit